MRPLDMQEGISMNDAISLADIAVLKSEVSGLHEAINEVSTKMDLVLSMRVELSVQGERLEHAVDDLNRTRDAVNKEVGILEQRVDNLQTHSLNTRKKLDAWLNRGFGAAAVMTLVFGLVQFMVLEKIADLNAMSSLVTHNAAQVEVILRAVKHSKLEFHYPPDEPTDQEQPHD